MAEPAAVPVAPTRARLVVTAVVVAFIVAIVWAVIDYRQQPPPPPNKVHELVP
ncbi:MAG: hypothetical protein ABIR38_10270 [Chthoniobacterales bacterium]|nr:hypothetical protein [Verrucomicrobiota bacterium]